MFLGQFRPMAMKPPGEEEKEPEQTQKPPEQLKSPSSEEFVRTPEAKEFISKWAGKMKDGKPIYTKRGITSLLRSLFQIPGLSSDKEVLDSGEELLTKLGGMDGLQGFLLGWKAKSEGIIKGLKSILGG